VAEVIILTQYNSSWQQQQQQGSLKAYRYTIHPHVFFHTNSILLPDYLHLSTLLLPHSPPLSHTALQMFGSSTSFPSHSKFHKRGIRSYTTCHSCFPWPFVTTGLRICFIQYNSKASRGSVDTRSVYSRRGWAPRSK